MKTKTTKEPQPLSERDEKLLRLPRIPADRAATRPVTAADFRLHEPRVAAGLEELGMTFAEASDYLTRHELLKNIVGIGRGVLFNYDGASREMVARLRDDLEKNPPPALKLAIRNMEAEIESRRSLGIVPIAWGSGPGVAGAVHMSARNRTAADEAATVRAVQALAKLRALVFVPDAEVQSGIEAILHALHQDDMAAMWEAAKPAAPAPVSMPRGELVAAEIE